MADLKTIYKASTLEQATANLHRLAEKWSGKHSIAVKSWEKNWEDLTTFFNYPADISAHHLARPTRSKLITASSGESTDRILFSFHRRTAASPLTLATIDITEKVDDADPELATGVESAVIRFEDRIDF